MELTLSQKIANIRKMVEVLQKNKSGYGYKYVSDDVILAKVSAGLEKYKIDVYPKIVPQTTIVSNHSIEKNKVLSSGAVVKETTNNVLVQSDMVFDWVNLENTSEHIEIPWVLIGQQSDASQAFGSGLTYCMRYFLLKFFKVGTVESDPDNWMSKKAEAMNAESKEVATSIISQVDEICKKNTTEENKNGLTEIVKNIVVINGKHSANYAKITDPDMASKLLVAVKEYFKIN